MRGYFQLLGNLSLLFAGVAILAMPAVMAVKYNWWWIMLYCVYPVLFFFAWLVSGADNGEEEEDEDD